MSLLVLFFLPNLICMVEEVIITPYTPNRDNAIREKYCIDIGGTLHFTIYENFVHPLAMVPIYDSSGENWYNT